LNPHALGTPTISFQLKIYPQQSPHPWDTPYQFSIKTLLSKKETTEETTKKTTKETTKETTKKTTKETTKKEVR